MIFKIKIAGRPVNVATFRSTCMPSLVQATNVVRILVDFKSFNEF